MTSRAPEPYVAPELYDLLFASPQHDLAFYVGLAKEAGGPVLDLCCGTGRTLLPVLAAGVDAEGVDLYPAMLDRLRSKARAAGIEARVSAQDMRTFELPRRFRLILVPFNALAHCLTLDDLLATLRRCARHLEPGGMVAFDVLHGAPEQLISRSQGTRVLERDLRDAGTGCRLRLFATRTMDWMTRRQHLIVEVEELDAAGNVQSLRRFETDMRWVLRSELDLLLRASGFSRHEIFGGFDRSTLSVSGQMVVLTRGD